MLATTGVLRGLQDTRTPLVVAVAGNLLNIVLNLLLVYGAGPVPGLGIAGSAWGSVLAQVASAAALLAVVVRAARREGASLTPWTCRGSAPPPTPRSPSSSAPSPCAPPLVTTCPVTIGAVDGRGTRPSTSPPTSWR